MTTTQTTDMQQTNAAIPEENVLEPNQTEAPTPLRRERAIDAYLSDADERLSPLAASLAHVNADLMKMQGYYGQDLELVLAEINDPKERLEWLHPVSEQVCKISKQINAFAQTTLRLEQARQRPTKDDELIRTTEGSMRSNARDGLRTDSTEWPGRPGFTIEPVVVPSDSAAEPRASE